MSDPEKLAWNLPVKELYEDFIQPTARPVGQAISLIPRAVNIALHPIEKWVLTKEYSFERTKELLVEKLKNTPPEEIVEPEPYVAVPAIQSLAYCMDSDALRNLYANLLANALQASKKGSVHPAYVEIIRQMSPLDARLLKHFGQTGLMPLCDICRAKSDTLRNIDSLQNFKLYSATDGKLLLISNVTEIDGFSEPLEDISVSISNLARLGLLSIPEETLYTQDVLYEKIDRSPRVIERMRSFDHNGETAFLTRKAAFFTSLGQAFLNICVND